MYVLDFLWRQGAFSLSGLLRLPLETPYRKHCIQTLPVVFSASLMLCVINVYLLGAQSEPVLQPVLGEANTIEDEEARRPRVKVHIWGDAQASSDCAVVHVHQLV